MSGGMAERAPIHLGSGEPILLLHPFLLSQSVWKYVAPQLAQTGRYEVFAPTMAGHHGGAPAPMLLDVTALADDIERRLDDLGWCTAHIVGNSLGGWVAFELERRGRARTLTGIAPRAAGPGSPRSSTRSSPSSWRPCRSSWPPRRYASRC